MVQAVQKVETPRRGVCTTVQAIGAACPICGEGEEVHRMCPDCRVLLDLRAADALGGVSQGVRAGMLLRILCDAGDPHAIAIVKGLLGFSQFKA